MFLLLYYILIYSAVDERIKKHVIAPICVRNTEVVKLSQEMKGGRSYQSGIEIYHELLLISKLSIWYNNSTIRPMHNILAYCLNTVKTRNVLINDNVTSLYLTLLPIAVTVSQHIY